MSRVLLARYELWSPDRRRLTLTQCVSYPSLRTTRPCMLLHTLSHVVGDHLGIRHADHDGRLDGHGARARLAAADHRGRRHHRAPCGLLEADPRPAATAAQRAAYGDEQADGASGNADGQSDEGKGVSQEAGGEAVGGRGRPRRRRRTGRRRRRPIRRSPTPRGRRGAARGSRRPRASRAAASRSGCTRPTGAACP